MPRTLEVIVTSLRDAVEAERGGADRLELVRNLELGGLTPAPRLVRRVLKAVSIPVRVMLRENAGMAIAGKQELEKLCESARLLGQLPIDGIVLGFIKDGAVDLASIERILDQVAGHRVTFHRAFEHVEDPFRAIEALKKLGQIDRILTTGGEGPWSERKKRLLAWQKAAAPEIRILVGVGLCPHAFADLKGHEDLLELHVGRAARVPQAVDGLVERAQVASLKSMLQ